ncbi:MAG: hypothetical protein ACOC1O_06475 [bacterium]
MDIVKFFYTRDKDNYYCEKTVFPDETEVFMEDGLIDWSNVKNYIGEKYVIIFENKLIEAGTIKDFYMETNKYEQPTGVIEFDGEIGDTASYFIEGDNNS